MSCRSGGLIVVDKRAGTGRSDFLPGGWLKRREDGPALEVRKAPRPVVKGAPLLKPAGEMFAEVWQRYRAGDVPGYEELRLTPYRPPVR